MYSIGEFSRLTGITVKALRFYHDQGLLEPSRVDGSSGYRYYADDKIETARIIVALKDLEFPLSDIAGILARDPDGSDIVSFLNARRAELQERMKQDRELVRMLDFMISHEQKAQVRMSDNSFQVEQKNLEPIQVASIRMQGRYSDCGKAFGRIGRGFGRHICGKGMLLCHDDEYREDDASFTVAMPIRRGSSTSEIEVQELPGGSCLSLMHRGPYEDLGRSYQKIMAYAQERGLAWKNPTREVYHKGPGMIFRGNPQKYLTEIQLLLDADPA